jgi:hypothetical protein
MFEFNPDGSLKLPDTLIKAKSEKEERMKKGNCILIKKELVSFFAPKKCVLHLVLSEGIKDNRFVENVYKYFCENASVLTKIKKIDEKEFEIEIGTDFKRCSDCDQLVARFRDFLDGNLIEEKGNCNYEGRTRNNNFCYEDHFE